LKRMWAPSHWMLEKGLGNRATRPNAGPHKLWECIPIAVLLKNRLKYALSGQEVKKICYDKDLNIKVDGKARRDHKYPLGMMDVVELVKTNEHFRMLYDVKGRYQAVRIDAKEANFKLCKIKNKVLGKNKIPYIVTHDGRTIRFPHPDIKKNDTVKVSSVVRSLFLYENNYIYYSLQLNLTTGEIESVIKFENFCTVFITGGNNIGRVGTMLSVEHHPGSYEIVHVKDARGHTFSTRLSNAFVIGSDKKPVITLPKGAGIRLSNNEDRELKLKHRQVEVAEEDAE